MMRWKQWSCIMLIISTTLLLAFLHMNHSLPSPILYIGSRDSHVTPLSANHVTPLSANHVTPLSAELHWALYQYQTRHKHCDNQEYNTSLWVSSIEDTDVGIVQVLVLGQVLDTLSCVRSKVVLSSSEFRQHGREVLVRAGWMLRVVEEGEVLVESLRGIQGFSKVVFVDRALFPVLSLDGVFDKITENTTVVSSSSTSDSKLIGLVPGSPSPHDVIIYHVVSRDYPHLAVDMSGHAPVWEWAGKPTRQEAGVGGGPIVGTTQLYWWWWQVLYEGLEACAGWHWWHESEVYRRFRHSDPLRDFRAVDIY